MRRRTLLRQQPGIVLAGATNLTINGANKIDLNAIDGFSASGVCTGTKVSGNFLTGNVNAGLLFSGAQSISVTSNKLTNNKAFGIHATGVCTNTVVNNIDITGSKTKIFVTATGGSFPKA